MRKHEDTGEPGRGVWLPSTQRVLRRRVQRYLFLTYGLLATLPFMALTMLGADAVLEARGELPRQQLRSNARALAISISGYLDEHRRLLTLAAEGVEASPSGSPVAEEEVDAWLERTAETAPGFLTLIYIGRDGRIVASHPRQDATGRSTRGLSVADREYFRETMRTGQPFVSDVFEGRGFGADPIVALSVPVLDRDQVVGVVEGSLDLAKLATIARPYSDVPGTRAAIADGRGRVLFASVPTGLEPLERRPEGSICAPAATAGGRAPIVGRSRTLIGGWSVEVCLPAEQVYGELRSVRTFLLATGIAGTLLSLVLAWFGSELAIRPVVASERRYRELMDRSYGLLCIHDLDGRLLALNPAAAEALGVDPDEVAGRDLRDFLHPAARDRLEPDYLEVIARDGEAEGVMPVVTRGGQERFWAYRNRLVRDGREEPYVVGHALDTTERRLAERELAERALKDPLTGVGNRALFLDRLELEIRRARRGGTTLGLLFLDLDGFKPINDTHGHTAGDAILRQVAATLQGGVREVDTVARLGGDEFAVLLPDVASAEQALEIARGLSRALAQPTRIGEALVRSPASIGLAIFPEDAQSSETLLAHADRSMYEAKRSGPGRVCRAGAPAPPPGSSSGRIR